MLIIHQTFILRNMVLTPEEMDEDEVDEEDWVRKHLRFAHERNECDLRLQKWQLPQKVSSICFLNYCC